MIDYPLPVIFPRKEYDTMCRCPYNIALAMIKMGISFRKSFSYSLPSDLSMVEKTILEQTFSALEFTKSGKIFFTGEEYRLNDLERQLLFFDSALSYDWLVNGKRQVHLLEPIDPMVYEVLKKMGYSIKEGWAGL